MPDAVVVRCPAKINLFLEILGKRPDGYHEIVTVMAPVSLCDSLEMSPARRDVLEVRPAGAAPVDPSNTVLRAIGALRRRRPFPPVRIRLVKRIPAGAGLGGGSSDAAGAVRAADRLFRLRLSAEERRAVLAEVGSDTAFFDGGGWALCRGRGEIVAPLDRGAAIPLVIVTPPFANPTAEVYRRHRSGSRRRSVQAFLRALRAGRDIAPLLFNRLEEAAFDYRPALRRIRREMSELPFEAVMMTGSGSSLFGVCRDRAGQRALAARARRRGWGRVCAVTTIGRRTEAF